MKKHIVIHILIASIILFPAYIFAQTPTEIHFVNPITSDSVSAVLLGFFQILVQLGAVAVTLAIIYSGFLFVMARGNASQLEQAKSTLFWTITGALVLLGAQVIAKVIQNTILKL